MTDQPDHPSSKALQREACGLRIEADRLMFEAYLADCKAEELEARLARLGLERWYVGSLERERFGRRLLAQAGGRVRA
jgi:hypothetical protein